MPAIFTRATRLALVLAAAAAASACGSFDRASFSIAESVTPYRVEIVQGNFISKEQVDALRPGLTRQQVREVLGTPLVMDLFHADRWDYVFTIRRQGVDPQSRRLTIFFKGDGLDRFEGDTMPAEAEFVATLDNKRKGAAVPPLEATEAQLKQYAPARAQAASAAPEPAPAAPTNYPPLEAPTR